MQPSEKAFDFPATTVTAQLATVLGQIQAVGAVGRDHANAVLAPQLAVGQIVPGSAGAQHPKNPVEHGAGILPWSPSLPNWFRVKERLQNRPLGVGEVHVAISTQARSSTISIWP